jgi:hypothetical protein
MGRAGIDLLRELVLDDPEVGARLLSLTDTEAVISQLFDVARSSGLDLSWPQIEDAIRGARQHWREGAALANGPAAPALSSSAQWSAPSSLGVPPALRGWTPVTVNFATHPPAVRWCYTEGVDFTDPFFGQTVERCMYDPFRAFFWRETTVDELTAWSTSNPGLEPAGLVFHSSRCGSTLMAQLFAGLASTLVLSEPEVLDHVLRSGGQGGKEEEEVIRLLRCTVSAIAQPRRVGQDRLVIKLDAWAVLWWPLFRRAFPMTPCVFLYREPSDVVASHLVRRGYHMVPGSLSRERLFGDAPAPDPAPPETYCAAVLAALFKAALAAALVGEMALCHYEELPGLVPRRLAPLFGVNPGPAGPRTFADVAARDAKNPWLAYSPRPASRPRVTPAVEAAVDASAGPIYERLEILRARRLESPGGP